MAYDVWTPYNHASSNLINAMAQYRNRQLAEEQARQEAAYRQQQNALAERQMRMQEAKLGQQMQGNDIAVQEARRKQGIENLKMAYHALDGVNDQASLERMRMIAANMLGSNTEVLDQIPTVYNDETAQTLAGWKNMYGNVLRGELRQKDYWVEDPTGKKSVAWFEDGVSPQLPEGYKFATPPNDNMDMARIAQETTLRKAMLDNAADIEQTKLREQATAMRQRMKDAASAKGAKFEKELKVKKYFDGLPEVKSWTDIEPQYGNMLAAVDEAKQQYGSNWPKMAYADQALIMTFNKMLDPDSVVREAEYARTADDQSMLSGIKSRWESIAKGGKLNPSEREAMVRMAGRFADVSKKRYNKQVDYVTGLSNRWGLNPENIIRLGMTPEKQAEEKASSVVGGNVESEVEKYMQKWSQQ